MRLVHTVRMSHVNVIAITVERAVSARSASCLSSAMVYAPSSSSPFDLVIGISPWIRTHLFSWNLREADLTSSLSFSGMTVSITGAPESGVFRIRSNSCSSTPTLTAFVTSSSSHWLDVELSCSDCHDQNSDFCSRSPMRLQGGLQCRTKVGFLEGIWRDVEGQFSFAYRTQVVCKKTHNKPPLVQQLLLWHHDHHGCARLVCWAVHTKIVTKLVDLVFIFDWEPAQCLGLISQTICCKKSGGSYQFVLPFSSTEDGLSSQITSSVFTCGDHEKGPNF